MVEDIERTPLRPKKRCRKALYFTSEMKMFRLSVRKKNVSNVEKRNMLNMIEETMKALDFDTIENDECAKNKEHADDCISESEMKTSSEKTTNEKVSQFNIHIV
jgi:hypothetical protein